MSKERIDRSPVVPQSPKLKEQINIRNFEFAPFQKEFIDLIFNKQSKIVFLNGPAGTTKTFLSIYAALKMLNEKKVSRIVYIRNVVESSSKSLGALPGTLDDKISPFMMPLHDKLEEFLSKDNINFLFNKQYISGICMSHLRGTNFNAQFLIADECFVGKTKIITEKGISSLVGLFNDYKKGYKIPRIFSYNEKNNKFEFKICENIVCNGFKDVIKLIIGNREIKCTPNHLFLTNNGWKEAQHLVCGDLLVSNSSNRLQVIRGLNDDQKQIILGSFLGDGSIQITGNNRFRLKVVHGISQKDYCKWKASIFNVKTKDILKNGYSQKPAISFATKVFSFGSNYVFPNKKSCPQWILDQIDERGLAIWYMDDGSIGKESDYIHFWTCSFDEESQKRIVTMLGRFNIEASYRKGKDGYFYIVLNKNNTLKFLDIIRPYIHFNLEYKVRYLNKNQYIWDNQFTNYYAVFDKIIKLENKELVYDLTIADNHNFLICSNSKRTDISGLVVHNCQNMDFKELTTLITRLGKFSKMIILGDSRQCDINGKSGFSPMMQLFNDEESRQNGVYCVNFGPEHVMRSEVVKFILNKLDNYHRPK